MCFPNEVLSLPSLTRNDIISLHSISLCVCIFSVSLSLSLSFFEMCLQMRSQVSPLWPEMGSFPYTPSLFHKEFSLSRNHSTLKNIESKHIFLSIDDDRDRGCLRGLCEREMIKGREFLLISEVSAVPPSSCSDDNDYACQGDCWWNQWNCLEFYSGCNDL